MAVIVLIEFIRSWILNIIIIATMIVLIEILIPSGKMKKYINMVSGIIMIIAVINPLTGLFNKEVNLKEFQILGSNYIDKKEIEKNSEMLERQQMEQIVEVYRQKIIRHIEEMVMTIEGVNKAEADVIINEDYTSKNFGEVKRAYIYLYMEKDSTAVKPVKEIKKVQVGDDFTEEEPDEDKNETDEIDNDIVDRIQKQINSVLGVKTEDIIISLQENRGDVNAKEDF